MSEPISPLMADILTQMANDTASITNTVIDNLTRDRDCALATLAAIRDQVEELCHGPYAPNPNMILDALYPAPEVIAAYMGQDD